MRRGKVCTCHRRQAGFLGGVAWWKRLLRRNEQGGHAPTQVVGLEIAGEDK